MDKLPLGQPWDMTTIVGLVIVASFLLAIWVGVGAVMLWQAWRRRGE